MIEQIEYRGFNINTYQDEDAFDPRADCDPLGKIALTHSRYTLGDAEFHEYKNGEDLIEAILSDVLNSEYKASAIREAWPNQFIDKAVFILQKLCLIFLPVYLLDHSGLSLRTGRFMEDPGGWDTSFIGFTYATKEAIINVYGDAEPENTKKAEKLLRAELETYGQYISGEVYGYSVEPNERNKSINCDDSCWGFYGHKDYDYMIEVAKENIDACITEYKHDVRQQKAERIATRAFYSTVWAD